jgi:putative hydrolase of the HAD superfamily
MLFIFDLGGVLVQNNDLVPEISRAMGIGVEELRDALHDSLVDLCSGTIGPERFWEIANHAFGTSIGEDLWETRYHPSMDRCVASLIAELRRAGHRVVAGTNTVDAHFRYHRRARHFALFDHVYASHLMGCVKPDPAFYRHILAAESTSPAETLFIDDMEANVAAAKVLGLEAIRFNDCAALRRVLSTHVGGETRSG